MIIYLLPKDGTFYKANLHMHTNVSDGKLTPKETKELYLKNGYSAVAFSDHEVMIPHTELTDDNFLAITATEIEIEGKSPKLYHFNLLSPRPENYDFPVFDDRYVWGNAKKYVQTQVRHGQYDRIYDADCVNDVIKKCNEKGFLVFYNHPVWSVQNAQDYNDLKGLWGVECFNTGCYIDGFEDTVAPIDTLLQNGERVNLLATDDAHAEKDCFGGWVQVKCKKLNYTEFFSALKNGIFYSSTGPEFNQLYIRDDNLTITCSKVKEVILSTGKRFARYKKSDKCDITKVVFDIKGLLKDADDPLNYFRITLIDKDGKRAWSNPYFLKNYL